MHFDDIWDEERWERFLRENDKRVDRYMDHLYQFISQNPLPDREDEEAMKRWDDELRAHLLSKGWRTEDAIFPLLSAEDQPGEEDFEGMDDFFDFDDEFEPFDDDNFEPFDDEFLDDEDFEEEVDGFRNIPIYQHAFALATEVLEWSNGLPGDVKDSTLVQFCTNVTQIPANIAKGHGIGYEKDFIGGNIACAKRGLAAANAALDQLRELKNEPYLTLPHYRRLYEHTFEVRNELGLYIQDLRERFDLGID